MKASHFYGYFCIFMEFFFPLPILFPGKNILLLAQEGSGRFESFLWAPGNLLQI